MESSVSRMIYSHYYSYIDTSTRYGEALVMALSWSSLIRDRQIGRGPRGFGGMVLDYIDAHT